VTMAKRPSCGHRIPTILPVIWGNDQSLRTATDWHDGQITRTGKMLSSRLKGRSRPVRMWQRANLGASGKSGLYCYHGGEKPKDTVWFLANAPKPPTPRNPNQLAEASGYYHWVGTTADYSEPSAASQLGGLGGLRAVGRERIGSRGNNAKRSPVWPPL
jgi:hypothetical protein